MQVTTPYAHAQAGKAERYVRTIEDGIQTLLADAKLPSSFWGDVALTTQYLCNWSPTSTLPLNATLYEIMHGTLVLSLILHTFAYGGANASLQYHQNLEPKVVHEDMRLFS
jgi:hypothetical protein